MIYETWPASDGKLEEIARETAEDKILSTVMTYTAAGWPKSISQVDPAVREFFSVKNELSISEGLLTKGQRIVIPQKNCERTS